MIVREYRASFSSHVTISLLHDNFKQDLHGNFRGDDLAYLERLIVLTNMIPSHLPVVFPPTNKCVPLRNAD